MLDSSKQVLESEQAESFVEEFVNSRLPGRYRVPRSSAISWDNHSLAEAPEQGSSDSVEMFVRGGDNAMDWRESQIRPLYRLFISRRCN